MYVGEIMRGHVRKYGLFNKMYYGRGRVFKTSSRLIFCAGEILRIILISLTKIN